MTKPAIRFGFRAVVHLGPAGQNKPDTWGFNQFPSLFRNPKGELLVRVNMGPDSPLGKHEPSPWFVSRDGGLTWGSIAEDQVDKTPEPVSLPDGTQVRVGDGKPARIEPRKLGIEPVFGPFFEDYGFRDMVVYRLGDLPAHLLRFPLATKAPGSDQWEQHQAVLDAPDLLRRSAIRGKHWFDPKDRNRWEDIEPSFVLPVPKDVTVLGDGTMLAPVSGPNPKVTDRLYDAVSCVASTDGGRTWRVRGTIADDTDQTSHGYGGGEMEIARMADGDLLCVMRTLMSAHREDSMYLAAARSSDGGFTWSRPTRIAPFSVRPHLLSLPNGMACIVYGRPGVYLRTSSDAGKSWSAPLTVVGPKEEDLLARPLKAWYPGELLMHSCANAVVLVTGADRFLLAYSDFHYPHPDGGECKAVLVQEVILGD